MLFLYTWMLEYERRRCQGYIQTLLIYYGKFTRKSLPTVFYYPSPEAQTKESIADIADIGISEPSARLI